MATIEQSMDVEVPIETAYNQWTQFEEPQFRLSRAVRSTTAPAYVAHTAP